MDLVIHPSVPSYRKIISPLFLVMFAIVVILMKYPNVIVIRSVLAKIKVALVLIMYLFIVLLKLLIPMRNMLLLNMSQRNFSPILLLRVKSLLLNHTNVNLTWLLLVLAIVNEALIFRIFVRPPTQAAKWMVMLLTPPPRVSSQPNSLTKSIPVTNLRNATKKSQSKMLPLMPLVQRVLPLQ